MAHFDSLKNEAIWEVEMKKLRSEREFRRENKSRYLQSIRDNQNGGLETSYRRRSSLKELIKAEEISRGIFREEKVLQPVLQASGMEKSPLQKGVL